MKWYITLSPKAPHINLYLRQQFQRQHIDQAAMFSRVDKFVRGNNSLLRVIPANKDFSPDDFSASEFNDGLIKRNKFIIINRTLQYFYR